MIRIFVDVDDTLINWLKDGEVLAGPNPYGVSSDDGAINHALVDAVHVWLLRRHMTREDPRLVVWSGGGQDYATTWADRAFPGHWHLTAFKRAGWAEPGDVVVDDQPIAVPEGVRLLTWQDFVAEVRDGDRQ